MREVQQPVRITEDDGWTETHPAYAAVEVSRSTGWRGWMFGSRLPRHDQAVTFRLRAAERRFQYHEDGHCAVGNILVEFTMTSAQFVEIMANMNLGGGVPVTLTRVPTGLGTSEQVPGIEFEDHDGTEASEALKNVKVASAEAGRVLSEALHDVEVALSEAGVPKKHHKAILAPIAKAQLRVGSNLPFVLDQVQEAAQRVVHSARAEVDAVVSTVVRGLGLQKLSELTRLGLPDDQATAKKNLTDKEG